MYTHIPSPQRFFAITALLVAGLVALAAPVLSAPPVQAGPGIVSTPVPISTPPPPTGKATPTPCGTGGGWQVVPAPDGGSYTNNLYSVAALAANDVWAVGEQYSYSFGSYVPMIEHWNGSAWSVVPASQYGVSLRGVAAIAPDDVWAVGWLGGYSTSPLAEHWNGSTWSYVQASSAGGRKLFAVAAAASNDVWTVGQASTGLLIMHWNGSAWTTATVPSIATGVLYGVTAIAPDNAWAVGTVNNAETLILHWDGKTWKQVPSPNSGAYINVLTGIGAAGSANVWAVGYWATSGVDYHGYTLHWDGTAWAAAPNPTASAQAVQPDDPTPTGTYLYGVATSPNGDAWAVGTRDTAPYGYTYPLVERFTPGPCP
jgi:hypothetical protein